MTTEDEPNTPDDAPDTPEDDPNTPDDVPEVPEEDESSPPPKRPLYYNIISNVGALIVVLGASLILVSLLAHVSSGGSNPYIGIFTYMVFPTFVGVGIVMILIGMRWEAGRRRRMEALGSLPYPRIDLNDRHQRLVFLGSIVGGTVIASLMVWASYQGFHYTESVNFCGLTCHVPMQPEYTAYIDSPHARVPCVECHVGEGASWYVRSKLSGARQLIAVLTHSYSTPIPTPIEHLRPARETCERCHWPEKFFGSTMVQLPHFRYDEANDAEQITLRLKTGGGNPTHGKSQGIHWHMIVANSVTFAAADKKLQVIPWVKVKHPDGSEVTYVAQNSKLTPGEIAKLPRRNMDCMDCHNRPAHNFPTPDSGVDDALLRGRIPTDLPWIKKIAVEALTRRYDDQQAAHDGIGGYIRAFYAKEYPKVLSDRKAAVDKTVEVVNSIYDRGVFPKMHVDWLTYPVNIGHRYWPGCFRCHDGKHVSSDGRVLAHDCKSTCHTEPKRGPITPLGVEAPEAYPDWHPWQMPKEHLDIKGHDMVLCYQCHASGKRPSRECKDCHEK